MAHLVNGRVNYGDIGTPTKMTYSDGSTMHVGDIVILHREDGSNRGLKFVVNRGDTGNFIMGLGMSTRNDGVFMGKSTQSGWRLVLHKKYKYVQDGEKIGMLRAIGVYNNKQKLYK